MSTFKRKGRGPKHSISKFTHASDMNMKSELSSIRRGPPTLSPLGILLLSGTLMSKEGL